jgi:hypothetical protein
MIHTAPSSSHVAFDNILCTSVVMRSKAMASAGLNMLRAADNMEATVEQRNFLSVAYNTHLASGPVVNQRSFRSVAKNSGDPQLRGERVPWHPVSFYESKSRRLDRTINKTR